MCVCLYTTVCRVPHRSEQQSGLLKLELEMVIGHQTHIFYKIVSAFNHWNISLDPMWNNVIRATTIVALTVWISLSTPTYFLGHGIILYY